MHETFFTADLHFSHSNIIKYCARPYRDATHMNAMLIQNWNTRVLPTDCVYVVGDFAMGPKERWPDFVKALNGYKILVLGNHDRKKEYMLGIGFNEVHEETTYQGWKLCHIPIGLTGNVLCGHVHGAWRRHKDTTKDIVNCGVDVWDFTPRTFEELMAAPVDNGLNSKDLYNHGEQL